MKNARREGRRERGRGKGRAEGRREGGKMEWMEWREASWKGKKRKKLVIQ